MKTPVIKVVPAEKAHIASIARRMRPCDRLEVRIVASLSPRKALEKSFAKSELAYTALVNGRPEVMFGVGTVNLLAGIGGLWLLGTNAIEKNGLIFLKDSRVWCSKLMAGYEVGKNLIHDENEVTKRWLKWLGAEFSEPFTHKGHKFRIFEMRRSDV